MTINQFAHQILAIPPDQLAAVDRFRRITYGQLIDAARKLGSEIGAEKQLVILQSDMSVDWLIAYVAVHLGGHAAVLVPSDIPDTAALAKRLGATAQLSPDTGFRVTKLAQSPPDIHPDVAVLLSTSGTTGSAKFVRLSSENLSSNAAAIAQYLGLDATERGVVNLPVQYSYALSIVNSHLWVGGAILLTDQSVVEPAFWEFCDTHHATSFAGVPHSYDLLARIYFADKAPKSLRYFTQAGGRLPPARAREFATLAQTRGWRFYVMYGQTEAAPRMAWLAPDQVLSHPGSIGTAIPGGVLSVRGADGSEVPNGEPGELVYDGPNVMMGYASTAADLAKGQGPARLFTGDLGYQSDAGLFYITGRKSRFVKVFGNRIGLDEVEKICADAGFEVIATQGDAQLQVVTRDGAAVNLIQHHLSDALKLPLSAIDVHMMPEFPTMASGKIDYAAAAQACATKTQETGNPRSVLGIFQRALHTDTQNDGVSFVDLGGDSLSYVHVALELENAFGDLPENWPTLPARDLQTALNAPQAPKEGVGRTVLRNTETLRACACILVVMAHVVGLSQSTGLQFTDTSLWRFPSEMLEIVRMPLFTALAGCLYAVLAPSRETLLEFVANKFLRLMVPAIVVSLIYFGLRSAMGHTEPPLNLAVRGYLHLWYLYSLFEIMVLVAIIDVFFRPNLRGWASIIAALYALQLVVPWSDATVALLLAPFFVLGVLVARNAKILDVKVVMLAAAVVALASFARQALEFPNPYQFSNWLRPLGSMAIILLALRFVPRIPRIEWIGLYSYAIYLWHPAANAAMRTLLEQIGVHDRFVLFACGVFVGLALPIVMFKIIKSWPLILRLSLIGKR